MTDTVVGALTVLETRHRARALLINSGFCSAADFSSLFLPDELLSALFTRKNHAPRRNAAVSYSE